MDYCTACDELWLDRNEWQLLQDAGLQTQLAELITDAGQAQIAAEHEQQRQARYFRQQLGEDVFARASETKAWLDTEPGKDQILQFLRS